MDTGGLEKVVAAMAKVNLRPPEPIDIRELVGQLCEALGIESKNVAEITITPANVRVIVYLENERGHKHASPAGDAIMTLLNFRVRT